MDTKRHKGIDIVKAIAMGFVVLLHVNGFILETNGLENYGTNTVAVYYLISAFCYCAIHLFVLAGSFLMIKKGMKISNIIKTYSSTQIICLGGLLVALIRFRGYIKARYILQCIFPFLGRAYWFVSDYIILMLAAPFLNYLIKVLKEKSRKYIIILWVLLFVRVSILPFILGKLYVDTKWSSSYFGLFVLLYVTCAVIMDSGKDMKNRKYIYLILYAVFTVVPFVSTYIIPLINKSLSANIDVMYFYDYFSPFVILQGMFLFKFFSAFDKPYTSKLLTTVVNASLIVYLYHMHPIFKNCYVSWGIFKFADVSKGLLYLIEVLTLSTTVYSFGVLISLVINPIVKFISSNISNLLEKLKYLLVSKDSKNPFWSEKDV